MSPTSPTTKLPYSRVLQIDNYLQFIAYVTWRGPMTASCWLSHRFEYTRESAGEERKVISFPWPLGYLITG